MKRCLILYVVILLISKTLVSQVVISQSGVTLADPSAMLEVNSVNSGILIPRMTQSEIVSIANPANGLQVYCTTDSKLYIYAAPAGVWKEVAYGAGTLTPVTSCATPITINHSAGPVAPVTKTTTYNVTTGVQGEPSKCWITKNLGASQQATAVSDATESAAGWYWQFNRKQGYMHDGTTRTPNSVWITSINENSDWTPANDPCTLELGGLWRVPTVTEWTNVDAAGGWTNWTSPWNSLLKLHAAGYLTLASGAIASRGVSGVQWSANQTDNYTSGYLSFDSSISGVYSTANKPYGFSVRCIR